MAIYTGKRQDEQQNQPQAAARQSTGTSGTGTVTGLQTGKYQQYGQGQAAQQANQRLQQVINNRPQGYNSKYGAQLDSIMQQIQNPEGFKYDFNGDELFKQFADLYTQKGKQASMDAMGQATALTGGYGNSYAQQVGDQAYQQKLLDLYSMAPEFYDMAWQRYQGEQGNLKDAYSMMSDRDATEYGRYRDTVADWEKDRDIANEDYQNERGREWQSGENALDRQLDMDKLMQQQTWQSGENALARAEEARQFDTNLDWLREQWAGDDAFRRDEMAQNKELTLSGRDWQSGENALDRAENARQADAKLGYDYAALAQDKDLTLSGRIWQSEQDAINRGWQSEENSLDRAENARQADAKLGYDYAALAQNKDLTLSGRDWESAENAAQRVWQTQENKDQRDWQSTENATQRDWESAESAAQRDWQAEQNDNELGYKYEALAQDTLNRDADRAESARQFDESKAQSAEQFEKTSELEWAQLEEKKRESDANLSFDEQKLRMSYAHDDVMAILANGQIPSNELLVMAGLSLADAKKLIAQAQATVTVKDGSQTGGSNTVYADTKGNYYTYKRDDKGNLTKQQVSADTVGNTDLVHNIYTEGAERRKTNRK